MRRPSRLLLLVTMVSALLLAVAAPVLSTGRPICAGQPATIIGTPQSEDLTGTRGDDVIWAGDGNDQVAAGAGNDIVCAGPGDDVVVGGAGADTIFGGTGNDTLEGGRASDILFGGPGADLLVGGWDADTLLGADGNDTLFGGPGADTARGGPGADLLDGGEDDDALAGNSEDDTLRGATGNDTCDGGAGTDQAEACEAVVSTEAGQVPLPLTRPGAHQVALTFDDGPSAAYTGQLLDILHRYGVPATFFVVGRQAAAQPELLRRMVEEGHSVQNHTYGHYWLTRYSDATITDQLLRTGQVIEQITGSPPHCLRPPFGAVNDRVRSLAADQGLAIIMWDVDPWDWKHPGAEAVAGHVLSHTQGGDIVLFHDTAGWSTIGALPAIIEGLRARGYEFVPICSVPGLAPRQAGQDGLL